MPSAGAESHGPHPPDMSSQVWVVYVKEKKNPKEEGWIAIHSRAIYWIEDPTEWWKSDEECRIYSK